MDAAAKIQKVASMRLDSESQSGSSAWWRAPYAFSRLSSWREGDGDDAWWSAPYAFSRLSSWREGDDGDGDDDALRWAALESLPTRDRVRRAILPPLGAGGEGGEAGAHQVVDVLALGPRERRALLERLVRVADEDNERFLLKLKDRVERVGIHMPTIEVRFEHLMAEAEVRVGTSGLPTVLNSITNKLEEVAIALRLRRSRKRAMPILHDISGIVRPRRMTLLLGPPGSGKTTLLLALAGRLDKDLKVRNSFAVIESACIDRACATRGQEANVISDYILKILGLEICADTMVGDEMLRGISGGQRKRVTTGEMLVGPANALFMDEISTGLDSSTTFQIIKSLRQAIHILGRTALISLLQPAPETYELFDDIILLSDGQIVYQGPREGVLEFFLSLGFKCPERKGVADFLQEVTSRKDQKQYWMRHDKPYKYVSVKKFASAFQSFHAGRALSRELAVPFDKNKNHPAALTTSRYGVSAMELLKANIDREILLMKRNSFVYIFRTLQLMTVSIVAMTLFFRTNMHRDSVTDGGIYMGALFFVVMMIMFNGFSELALTIIKLPVFFKQRDLLFFPAWAYTIPTWILKIPISFVEVGGFVFMAYYVIGFDPNVGRFFKQYILLLALNQMAASFFRFVGGAARNIIVANVFGSFMLLIFMVLGGYILVRDKVKKWWIWGYWISPLMYAQNAISVNEMLGHSWDKILNSSVSNETLGVQCLKSRGVFPEAKWYWIGFGALLGFIMLFNCLFTLALAYLKPYGKSHPSVSEEELKEKYANLNGNALSEDSLAPISSHRATIGTAGSCSATAQNHSCTMERGLVLPFTPLSLTFNNIKYFVDMPQVTVYESLLFSAWLRLPRDVDLNTRKMFIEEVMELVELRPLRNALVGLPGVNGLSTEQRKRLTIAVELVANPSIIFMDEPTSGLDARAAAIVMRTVRNTVDTGRTVVCTIHQPSIDIFEAFDELFLMKRGGEEIYVGPLGHHSSELINYFEV
nr:unnamed protein product [Digitaria exilis]